MNEIEISMCTVEAKHIAMEHLAAHVTFLQQLEWVICKLSCKFGNVYKQEISENWDIEYTVLIQQGNLYDFEKKTMKIEMMSFVKWICLQKTTYAS